MTYHRTGTEREVPSHLYRGTPRTTVAAKQAELPSFLSTPNLPIDVPIT